MECVILFRNTQNGRVGYVSEENGEIKVFADMDEAIEAVPTVPILEAFPHQIVELDEL